MHTPRTESDHKTDNLYAVFHFSVLLQKQKTSLSVVGLRVRTGAAMVSPQVHTEFVNENDTGTGTCRSASQRQAYLRHGVDKDIYSMETRLGSVTSASRAKVYQRVTVDARMSCCRTVGITRS